MSENDLALLGERRGVDTTRGTRRPPINPDGRVAHGKQHGWSREPLYAIWRAMLARCYNPKNNRFHRYGERGIGVCEEWWEYPQFRAWAQKSGFRSGLSIDRINGNESYAPENCRWATSKDQNRNRTDNRLATAFGVTKTLAEWADDPRCAVTYKTLWSRVQQKGIPVEQAMGEAARPRTGGYRMIVAWGEQKSVTAWLKDERCNVPKLATLWKRIDDGWAPERAIATPIRERR